MEYFITVPCRIDSPANQLTVSPETASRFLARFLGGAVTTHESDQGVYYDHVFTFPRPKVTWRQFAQHWQGNYGRFPKSTRRVIGRKIRREERAR